jgi:hypothetical protein
MALYILSFPPQTPPTQDRIYRAFLSGHALFPRMSQVSKKVEFLVSLARKSALVNQII